MTKKFPDLTGDGKVTQADILKGRKVFAKGGSLMVPVERQQKSAGGVVLKQVLKAITKPKTSKAKTISNQLKEKYDSSELEEMAKSFVESVENNTKMTSKGTVSLRAPLTSIAEEAADKLNKDRDASKNIIDPKDIIKISRLDDLRAGGGGKTDSLLDSVMQSAGSIVERPSIMGSFVPDEAAGTRPVRKSQTVAGAKGVAVGSLLTGGAMSAWQTVNKEPPQTKKEASDFEKAFSAAFKSGKDTFEFKGKKYTTELERESKSIGGILGKKAVASFAGAKAAKEAPKATAARKAALANEEADRAVEMLEDALMEDPEFLDRMDPEDLQALLADLPPEDRARLSPDMGDVQEDTLELIRGMDPAEVADNLQLFNSLGQLRTYTGKLNPQETREFLGNVSPEDYDMFEGFRGLIKELGPREMKAEGGPMKPDAEMEKDYVSYVMSETLSDDEIDYMNKILEEDDKLNDILDKVILSAAEFQGSGEVEGPGTGTSDEIPARLSDGEFVFTKKATDEIGADNLQQMMEGAEKSNDKKLVQKAVGGLMQQQDQMMPEPMPMMGTMPTANQESQKDIQDQMIGANRMPSLMMNR